MFIPKTLHVYVPYTQWHHFGTRCFQFSGLTEQERGCLWMDTSANWSRGVLHSDATTQKQCKNMIDFQWYLEVRRYEGCDSNSHCFFGDDVLSGYEFYVREYCIYFHVSYWLYVLPDLLVSDTSVSAHVYHFLCIWYKCINNNVLLSDVSVSIPDLIITILANTWAIPDATPPISRGDILITHASVSVPVAIVLLSDLGWPLFNACVHTCWSWIITWCWFIDEMLVYQYMMVLYRYPVWMNRYLMVVYWYRCIYIHTCWNFSDNW